MKVIVSDEKVPTSTIKVGRGANPIFIAGVSDAQAEQIIKAAFANGNISHKALDTNVTVAAKKRGRPKKVVLDAEQSEKSEQSKKSLN